MHVAILSESGADEAALRILGDLVLGVRTTPVERLPLRSRGWPAVRNVLPVVIRYLQFRTNADGLIVVVDSDHTSLQSSAEKNRLRNLDHLIQQTLSDLSEVRGRAKLRVAFGIAAPALEAWLLCRTVPEISEQAWERGLIEKRDPYTKIELKRRLYRVEFPSFELSKAKMTEAAAQCDINHLNTQFPSGFGHLSQQLRNWRSLS